MNDILFIDPKCQHRFSIVVNPELHSGNLNIINYSRGHEITSEINLALVEYFNEVFGWCCVDVISILKTN